MNKQYILKQLIELSDLIDRREYEEDRDIYEITWEQEAQKIIESITEEIQKP
jgi:transcription initiation factor IIE alpha subunit